jgi:hypothetical protein
MTNAIAIITHSRDRYFELVLLSILNQKIAGAPISDCYDIFIFQDGLAADATAETGIAHARISAIAESASGSVEFIRQDENLGIARHFDYIERFLFMTKNVEYAFFFEDDLMLAPDHLHVLDLMRRKFKHDSRVGMLSANSEGAFKSRELQAANRDRYVAMDHNWGFGISRDFWLRRQPFVDIYLSFVKDIRYKDRPTRKILNWLRSCGLQPHASSQDYIKQCATLIAGGVRISTYPNFGLYIGREGVHCTSDLYSKMGFSNSITCDLVVTEVAPLLDEDYLQILDKQKRIHLNDVDRFDIDEWGKNIRTGKLEHLATEAREIPTSSSF